MVVIGGGASHKGPLLQARKDAKMNPNAVLQLGLQG